MTACLGRLVIYTKKLEPMAEFYSKHFGYSVFRHDADRITELVPSTGGCAILLHPAARSQKEGQALVKLVFDVEDVAEFCASCAENGLTFGKIHQAKGYVFANAKDPAGNSVQVSSRAFARRSFGDSAVE